MPLPQRAMHTLGVRNVRHDGQDYQRWQDTPRDQIHDLPSRALQKDHHHPAFSNRQVTTIRALPERFPSEGCVDNPTRLPTRKTPM
jgi:hypothetical protein